jgi:diaminopimelate decarboxylase
LHSWGSTSVDELHELAQRYGTPFYLYDADAINARLRRIKSSIGHGVQVLYAVKANPNLELLRAVREAADGLDISSGGELEQAQLAQYEMAKLSFAGPAKTPAELAAAVEAGVGCISIESTRELAACIDVCKRSGTRAGIALRVNPQHLNRSFGLKMGGKAVQFGIDEEELPGTAATLRAASDHLNFLGIHVYAGSQCFDVAGVVEGAEDTFRITREFEESTGFTCRTVNLGGGFGVSHGEDGRELDLESLGPALAPALRAFQRLRPGQRNVVFELGRFLTANAGIYVTRVIGSKASRGKSFFVVDGGLHHHLAAAGTFGAALRSNFALRNLSRPEAPKVLCNVAGPSCNPTDLLGIDVELPRPQHGDLVAVLRAGSYGFTASPLLFLGRPTPAELVRHRGKIVLGRRSRSAIEFN